jgi:hypothetical protein
MSIGEAELQEHIDLAASEEYQGEPLGSRDYLWFVVAGVVFPLSLSLFGWAVS